jgi:hypothetical protein
MLNGTQEAVSLRMLNGTQEAVSLPDRLGRQAAARNRVSREAIRLE